MKRRVREGRTRIASDEYGVTSLSYTPDPGEPHRVMPRPCGQCPWRRDVPVGVFPAEAYRISAPTAYDMAASTFACHMAGREGLSTCAGFALRHRDHNMVFRLAGLMGKTQRLQAVTDGGLPLYPTYREMAVANGVAEDDPVLGPVRGNGYE